MRVQHYPAQVLEAFEEAGETLVEFMSEDMTPQCEQFLADYLKGIEGSIKKAIELLEREK